MKETNKVHETIKDIKAPTQPKKVETLRGITTSQINQALKAKSPYPARVFLKVKKIKEDIPVFFRIKDPLNKWERPKIKTGSYIECRGYFESSKTSSRPSFTCLDYQLFQQEQAILSHDKY